MTTAIFGGTFNPVHKSHVMMADYVNSLGFVDELLIMPANIPPHKEAKDLIPSKLRLGMCELAFSHLNKARICDLEINRIGKSYTFDTLTELSKDKDKLTLVCGGDMIETFHKWYKFKEILALADIIAFSRIGSEKGEFEKGVERIRSFGGNVYVADISVPELSSTKIRNDIKNGLDVSEYMPESVAEYIRTNGLYR